MLIFQQHFAIAVQKNLTSNLCSSDTDKKVLL